MTVNPHPGVGSLDPEAPATGPVDPVPRRHGGDPVRCGVPGVGEFRALWVNETTLAWPDDLFPRGAGAGGVCFSLVCSPDGSVYREVSEASHTAILFAALGGIVLAILGCVLAPVSIR